MHERYRKLKKKLLRKRESGERERERLTHTEIERKIFNMNMNNKE